MTEFLYIPLILLLYWRTWKYKVLVDDPVPRDGYMYVIQTDKFPKEFHEKRRSYLATVTNIGVFIATCGYMHYLWGWKAALLYALMPLNVNGVAWTTGNYYMSTVLLVLCGQLLTGIKTFWTLGLGMGMYAAALNSTLSSIPFIVFLLPTWYGWAYLLPFTTFMFGKRMTTGLRKRKGKHDNMNMESGKFRLKNLLYMVKTTAYYIYLSFWPSRLGFFHNISHTKEFWTPKFFYASLALCFVFFTGMIHVDWYMTFWWFAMIGIFSQFVIFGQFTAERYTFLANVAFCVLMAKLLPFTPFVILASLWFYRSHLYIKSYADNERLFIDSAKAFPHAPGNYNNWASIYLDYHKWWEALNPLLLAKKYTNGNMYNILSNLSTCYYNLGKFTEAHNYTLLSLQDKNCPKDQVEPLKRQLEVCRKKLDILAFNQNRLRKMGVL